ncbi:hypothetical protein J4N02_08340 [Propioniciclava sp. MC1595]|uniref:hypothetical protein n=1 Tax=unclassified Propioniciclava TaxID=2642922 RepID=UPI001601116B|nr:MULTISPECIES: hypothetical protein [unclassified Propioniciclava]MBB1495893.1 hypothetical protein [Propioniciclava sp. MC1595]MBB1500620.1 hypothetical protein [Propioniciclava sp. MC1683]QTE24609.1 hypothetical protein J4N02_08340 [Propioniciclava sp. MC1595]
MNRTRALSVKLNAPVDDRTADDLRTGVTDLAASATAPSIGRAERLARAARAAEHARNLADVVPLLDPYAGTEHNRMADLQTVATRALAGETELDGAVAERLLRAEQFDRLTHATRAAANLTGLRPGSIAPTVEFVTPARWLAAYALPAAGLGPIDTIPAWGNGIPAATLNPGFDNPITGADLDVAGDPLPWSLVGFGVNTSRQRFDWAADKGAESERLFLAAVHKGLEKALLDALAAAAPAAASFEAAEVAAGATDYAADLVVVNPQDAPKVTRAYATAFDGSDTLPPRILPTAGATKGTALVMASPAVYAVASRVEWVSATRPREWGVDVAALMWGRARVRIPGAVQKVVVA